jgi:hypothetical protein
VKARLAILPLAALAALAVPALGQGNAARPALSALPEGDVSLPAEASRPSAIPATEQLSGIRIAQTGRGAPGGVPQASFAGLAMRKHRGKMAPMPIPVNGQIELTMEGVPNACLAVSSPGRDTFRAAQLFLDAAEHVVPLRAERLEDSGGAAKLHVIDAWVDASTGGAREIRRTTIPLARLAEGPLGSVMYAFRSGASLRLVVPADGNAQIFMTDGRTLGATCGHIVADLQTERGKGSTLRGFVLRQAPIEGGQTPVRISVAASLSQTSLDAEPLLSATLRAMDPIPEPPRAVPRADPPIAPPPAPANLDFDD